MMSTMYTLESFKELNDTYTHVHAYKREKKRIKVTIVVIMPLTFS